MLSGFVFSLRICSAKITLRLGRDRRVGGFRPMRLELVRGLFVPVPFELARRPTHHFSDRPCVFCHRKRPGRSENGGLVFVLNRQAIGGKGFCTGDNVRESTHPPYEPAHPAVFRVAAAPGVSGSGEDARKMVGWTPCKVGRPSVARDFAEATTPGNRPTHPTIPARHVRLRHRRETNHLERDALNRYI